MKIVHVITTASNGGAQSVLADIVQGWGDDRDRHLVVSLREECPPGSRLKSSQVPLRFLSWPPGRFEWRKLTQLADIIRAEQPDVVQTWLYHADLVGSLSSILTGGRPTVWGIHHTLAEANPVSRPTGRLVRLLALLSRVLPAQIVCCSATSLETHARIGYPRKRLRLIRNGVNTEEFRPDPKARPRLLHELRLPADARLVAMFGRYHPLKDHANFVRAAARLHADLPGVHFILAGAGLDAANATLIEAVRAAGLTDWMHLLGERQDMPGLAAGVDLVTLSSSAEALPRSLLEAMSCGTPCVATNVGDVSDLIADTGIVVPAGDPIGLAEAWRRILMLPAGEFERLGRAARLRIVESYGAQAMIDAYKELYRSLAQIRK